MFFVKEKSILIFAILVLMVFAILEIGICTEASAATNLALNKPVTCSSQQTGNEASHMVDGDAVNTRWSASPYPQWAQVDLGAIYSINSTTLAPYSNRAYQYKVEVSTDGTNFAQVVNRTGNTTGTSLLTDTFAAVNARYVKLTVTGCYNYTGGWISINEFQVLGNSPTPTPTPTLLPTSTPTPTPLPTPGINLALNKSVTCSSEQTGNEASHMVDGDAVNTRWSASPYPQWVQIDLGAIYSISSTELAPYSNRAYQYKVEISTNGTNFTQVVDRTGNTTGASLLTDTFAAVNARYVKLTVTGCYNYTGTWISINEFQVFGNAPTPTPTPLPTVTPTPTPTSLPTVTPTPTPTSLPIVTPTPTPLPIVTPTPTPNPGRTINVSSISQLNSAISSAIPGDMIIIADGTYNGSINSINLAGNSTKPITIKAADIDQVVFTGSTHLSLSGASFIIIEGIKFTCSNTAVSLSSCNNVQVTRCHFQLKETGITVWFSVNGTNSNHNRLDHCLFEGKTHAGQYIDWNGSGSQVSQYDIIDHNYIRNVIQGDGNGIGWESLRLGLSGMSMSNSFALVEKNLFENCDGENETISIKSCGVTLRYNTMRNNMGQMSLRHGNRNTAYGNFFFGDGVKSGVGGIRAYGEDHRIFNNYFEGLTGSGQSSPIDIDGGDTYLTGALTGHWRVQRAQVCYNTIVNCAYGLTVGSSSKQYQPLDCRFANNIIVGSKNKLIDRYAANNDVWEGNIAWPTGSATVGVSYSANQVRVINPLLVKTDIYRLSSTSPAINASLGSYPFVTDDLDGQSRIGVPDVGADEYSTAPIINLPLTAADVGIYAP